MKNRFLELFEKCDEKLKTLAFTHSSYSHDTGMENNERIEFLGDTVLSTIVGEYLYQHTNFSEGKMTKIRSTFVCTESLANLARELNIEDRLIFGKSFKGSASDAILADTIESMIGAMFLSFGFASIKSAVLQALKVKDKLKEGMRIKDYKSELQEITQANKQKLKYTSEMYTTKGGQENFRASIFIDNEFLSYGQGSTKREAEQNAAKLAITKLKKKED